MNHRPSTLTTLLLTRLGLSPNSTARASKSRARHLLAPFAIAAMLLGLAGNANAQALSFGAEPSIDDQVYTVGQAVDVTLPQATGGVAPLTYSLTRTNGNTIPPPRGVIINPTARTLRGTPEQVAEAVSYRWTVTDSASPVVMQHIPFTITVNAAPVENIAPAFVAGASIGAETYYKDTEITPLTLPRATGGEGAITYALTPAIPGMFFDTVTGVLSGTPTTVATATTYTYTAGDTDGSAPGTDEATLTISITVLANTIPTFSVLRGPRYIYTVGTVVNETLPEATGGDGTLVYTLSRVAFLPDGLTFNAAATPPTITGTPTTAARIATYRYNVDDSDANEALGDGSSLSIRITIRGAAATGITMTIRDLAGNEITSLNEDADPTTFRLHFDTVPALSGFTADQDVAITVSTPVAGQVGYTAAGRSDFIDRDVASESSGQLQLTVTDDDVATADGVVTYTATVSPSGFTATAMLTLVDNEISIVTTPAAVTLATGSTADYTVQLDQEPPGSVTVSVVSVGDAIATVSRNTRVFTAANWNVPVPITVTGMRGGSTTISHSATAAGGFGYQSTDVMVTVTPVAVNFDADESIPDQIYTVGTAIDPLTLPTATGATTYRLSSHADQSLPAGLTFDGAARPPTLTGTPTAAQVAEGYAYSARNPDNLDNRNFDITVNPVPGTPPTSVTLSVNPAMVTESADPTTITVTATVDGGTFTTERVVTFNSRTGDGTAGTATEVDDYTAVSNTNLTIPANAASGTTTFPFTAAVDTVAEPDGETVEFEGSLFLMGTTLPFDTTVTVTGATLTINDPAPMGTAPAFADGATIAPATYTVGQMITPLTLPAVEAGTGNAPITYTLNPAVPGLTLNPTTRVLTGAPTTAAAVAGYAYTATDTDNDAISLAFRITVNAMTGTDTAPTFSVTSITAQTFTTSTVVDLTLPAATGGEGTITYTLTPAIPGLDLNAATGVLTGTPTTVAGATTYTYTAGDTDGSAAGTDEVSLTISVTVNAAAVATRPVFFQVAGSTFNNYDEGGTAVGGPTTFFAEAGTETVVLTLTGADAAFFSITQAGALSFSTPPDFEMPRGMPPSTSNTNTYRVTVLATASPGGLTQDQAVEVQVVDVVNEGPPADTAPAFAADAAVSPRSYSRFAPIPPFTLPQATGGNGDITYTLTPAIPGLTLDAGTGVLTGTPTTQATLATYTLTAADSDMTTGTSDEDTFTFEVVVHPLTEATGWQLVTVPAVVTESATATEITVTASYIRNGRSADERVATFQTQGGVATAGTDYIAVPTTTITIPALETSASVTIQFMATPDTETETGNESVFFVGTLRDSAGDLVTVTFQRGTLFIQDPPPVPTSVTLSVNPAMVSESADATTITVTATPVGGRFAEERRVTLSADSASTATVTTDYTPAITHTITIPANAASGSVDIPFTAVMDTETEAGGETVIIQRNLATAGGTAAVSGDITVTPATLTINDPAPDTTPAFSTTVSAQVYSVGTAVNLTLPTVTDGNGVITYTLTPTALAAGLTFNAAANPPTITGTPNTQASATTYTYTATDEDGDDASLAFPISVGAAVSTTPTTQTLTISPTMVTESATATTLTAMVTLTGGTYNVERLFNIRTTQSGTATAVTDYTVFSNVVLTIPANMASGSQTFPFTAIDDMTADDGETLSITSTLLRLSGMGADTSLAAVSATLTINDPVAGLTFGGETVTVPTYVVSQMITPLTLPVATGGDGAITYTLTGTLPTGLTFDGTASPPTITGTPTGAAGATMHTYTATDTANATATLMFSITIDAADTAPAFTAGAAVSAQTFTIGTAVDLTLPAATGGNGASTYTLTPVIPGLTLDAATGILTGTPTAEAGATMHTYTAGDTDGNEAGTDEVSLMFSITVIQAPPTRIDLSVNPTAVTESSTATTVTVTATLIDGSFAAAENITIASADGTATSTDYTAVTNTVLTIPANMASGTATFSFTANVDTNAEPDGETVSITGTAASGTTVNPATITINDYAITVDAGADRTVGYGSTITLNGEVTGSTDTTAAWALSNGAAAALEAAGLTMAEATMEVTRLTAALAGTGPDRTFLAPAANLGLTDPVALAFTLTVTDNAPPGGQTAAMATDTVTITVEADTTTTIILNEAILPEVTRALVNSTTSSITRRVGQAVGSGSLVPSFNFAGQSMGGQDNLAAALRTHGEAMSEDSRDIKEILADSNFVLPLNGGAGGASSVAFWGSADYLNLSGDSGNLDWDGDVFGVQFGLDTRLRDDLLVGVAVSLLESDVDYKGTVGSIGGQGEYAVDMTSVHPYISGRNGGADWWATVGSGSGELEITTQGLGISSQDTSDIDMQTLGAGSSMLLLTGATTLRLKGEIVQSSVDVDDSDGISEQSVDANRIRIAMEVGQSRRLDGGRIFEPSLEIGARFDGGDGETGGNAEIGGELRYRDPASRITLDGQVRTLLDYEEWGISGTVRVAAGADGQGLSFSMSPGYGNSGSGVQELWRKGLTDDDRTDTTDDYAMRLDGRVGYGFGFALNDRHGILTPYSEMTRGTTDSYRMGLNWKTGTRFDLTLLGERSEPATDPVGHAVLLKGEVRF